MAISTIKSEFNRRHFLTGAWPGASLTFKYDISDWDGMCIIFYHSQANTVKAGILFISGSTPGWVDMGEQVQSVTLDKQNRICSVTFKTEEYWNVGLFLLPRSF